MDVTNHFQGGAYSVRLSWLDTPNRSNIKNDNIQSFENYLKEKQEDFSQKRQSPNMNNKFNI